VYNRCDRECNVLFLALYRYPTLESSRLIY